jgi:hypothetical protein
MLILHGEGGYLDELAIVVVGFVVLWVAVRLSSRKAAEGDEDLDDEDPPERVGISHTRSHDDSPSH